MALNVSMIMTLVDKVTAPAKRVAASIKDIKTAANGAARPANELVNAVEKIDERPVSRLSRALTRIRSLTAKPFIVRTAIDQKRLQQWRTEFGRTSEALGRKLGTALRWGGMAGVAAVSLLLRKIIEVGKAGDIGFATKFGAASKTLSASWDGFLLKIGQAGLFDFIIAKMTALNQWIAKVTASGQLDKWAKEIARAFAEVGNWLASINWIGVAKDIAGIARSIGTVVGWIARLGGGGLSGIFNVAIVAVIGKIAIALYGLGAALGLVTVAGAPLWAVVAVIAAIAAGAVLVYRNWDSISAWFAAKWESLKAIFASAGQAIVTSIQSMWARAKASFVAGVNAVWNALPGWVRGVFKGASFGVNLVGNLVGGQALPAAAGNAARSSGILPQRPKPALGGAQKVSQSNYLQVDLRSEKGVQARVSNKKLAANTSVTVNRGHAMGRRPA